MKELAWISLNDQRNDDPSLSLPLRTIRFPSAPPSSVLMTPKVGADPGATNSTSGLRESAWAADATPWKAKPLKAYSHVCRIWTGWFHCGVRATRC
jgi:hypothetical protein